MTDREQVERLLHRAAQAFDGRIDVLMLNHAAVDDALVFEYNSPAALEAGLQSVLHANVVGSAIATRVALPYLEAAGGTVAVVSSASTIAPAPFHAAYVASKRALHGWFDTFRHELRLVGSRVAVQLQVLGMIGTPAIMKDPGNHRLAISVEECASAMICAAQGKWREVFVPYWYAPMTAALRLLGPWLGELAINHAYVFNSAEYVERIAAAKTALNL